ncbi:hypothetical protein PCE1_002184 [Barthelona sp. PCE]
MEVERAKLDQDLRNVTKRFEKIEKSVLRMLRINSNDARKRLNHQVSQELNSLANLNASLLAIPKSVRKFKNHKSQHKLWLNIRETLYLLTDSLCCAFRTNVPHWVNKRILGRVKDEVTLKTVSKKSRVIDKRPKNTPKTAQRMDLRDENLLNTQRVLDMDLIPHVSTPSTMSISPIKQSSASANERMMRVIIKQEQLLDVLQSHMDELYHFRELLKMDEAASSEAQAVYEMKAKTLDIYGYDLEFPIKPHVYKQIDMDINQLIFEVESVQNMLFQMHAPQTPPKLHVSHRLSYVQPDVDEHVVLSPHIEETCEEPLELGFLPSAEPSQISALSNASHSDSDAYVEF